MRAKVFKSVSEIDPYGVIDKQPFQPQMTSPNMMANGTRNLNQSQTQNGGQPAGALPARLSLFQQK